MVVLLLRKLIDRLTKRKRQGGKKKGTQLIPAYVINVELCINYEFFNLELFLIKTNRSAQRPSIPCAFTHGEHERYTNI